MTTDISALLALDVSDPAAALAFRRGVAELAGWRIEKVKHLSSSWHVYDPDGMECFDGEEEGYKSYWYDSTLEDVLPAYESSLDAALTLLDTIPGVFRWRMGKTERQEMEGSPTRFEIEIGDNRWAEFADTPALAVCRAYLRYRAAQSAPVATSRDEEDMTW